LGQRLGQHFLRNSGYLEKIAEAACPSRAKLVVEIGAGRGALTRRLLCRADRVVAIELDGVLADRLQREFPDLAVIAGDVLAQDLTQWGRCVVVGNLPYYITSPVVAKVLAIGGLLERAVFLVQREVAQRIAARPRSRAYGYLSVASQLLAETRVLFKVPPGAFSPPPNVESAVVSLVPRPLEDLPEDRAALLRFVGQCFRHKRKTLRNNLSEVANASVLADLPGMGRRAEELTLAEFLELWNRLSL